MSEKIEKGTAILTPFLSQYRESFPLQYSAIQKVPVLLSAYRKKLSRLAPGKAGAVFRLRAELESAIFCATENADSWAPEFRRAAFELRVALIELQEVEREAVYLASYQ